MAARGLINAADEDAKQNAFRATMQLSLLPWPKNARALGLLFLSEERPDIVSALPRYGQEFDSLLLPVLQATMDGTFFQLYERLNPHMQYVPSRAGFVFGPKEEQFGSEPE